ALTVRRPKIVMSGQNQMETVSPTFALGSPFRVAHRATKVNFAAPVVLKLIVLSILLPDEVGFYLEGLWFSVARVVLLMLTPVLLVRFGRMVFAGQYRFVLSDLFVLLTGTWMFVALAIIDGMQESLIHAGPLALEFCIGYMTTRVLLSRHGQAL